MNHAVDVEHRDPADVAAVFCVALNGRQSKAGAALEHCLRREG